MLDISERSIHLRLGQEPRDEQHQGKSFGESFLFYYSPYSLLGASQVALVVKKKNLPTNSGDTRDMGSILGSENGIPWSRKWQPTPVFSPG